MTRNQKFISCIFFAFIYWLAISQKHTLLRLVDSFCLSSPFFLSFRFYFRVDLFWLLSGFCFLVFIFYFVLRYLIDFLKFSSSLFILPSYSLSFGLCISCILIYLYVFFCFSSLISQFVSFIVVSPSFISWFLLSGFYSWLLSC